MELSHAEQVAQLEIQCFSDPWSIQSIRSEISNPLSLWLAAVEGDVVLGYIGSQSVLGEADMMNLAVSEDHRRRGIAQALVLALMEQLKRSDVYRLTLEVRVSNASAISLYEKLGFQHIGRRPNYYYHPKEDALILGKEL
jgi:ribosomal-protein-alanine N-acetyltransferase